MTQPNLAMTLRKQFEAWYARTDSLVSTRETAWLAFQRGIYIGAEAQREQDAQICERAEWRETDIAKEIAEEIRSTPIEEKP